MRTLTEALDQRVLLADGSTGALLRGHRLDLNRDLYGTTDCLDVLNLTRPRLVRDAHVAFLEAGADVIRTQSAQASPLSLQRLGMADEAFYINYSAAQNACKAVDSVPGYGRRRFVLGIVNDEGWLASPALVERAFAIQVEGLLAGGVDGVAIVPAKAPGRAAMVLRAARRVKQRLYAQAPIFLQRTCTTPELCGPKNPLADAVICYYQELQAGTDSLKTAIRVHQINLIDGGRSPVETRARDQQLRALAEDGLRPVTQWYRDLAVDEIEPASSVLYLEPTLGKVS